MKHVERLTTSPKLKEKKKDESTLYIRIGYILLTKRPARTSIRFQDQSDRKTTRVTGSTMKATDFVSVDFEVPHPTAGDITCNLLRRRRRTGDIASEHDNGNTIAIVCHPYSYFGGDMHNYVVCLIQQAIAPYMPCIRFNFTKASLFGSNEAKDANALIAHLLTKTNKDGEYSGYDKVLIAGYSAGAHVAIHAAQHLYQTGGGKEAAAVGKNPLAGLLAVSGAFGRVGSWALGHLATTPTDFAQSIPCTFVNGEYDQYCGAQQYCAFVQKFFNTECKKEDKSALEQGNNLIVKFSPSQKAVLVPDADHFWTQDTFNNIQQLFSSFVTNDILKRTINCNQQT